MLGLMPHPERASEAEVGGTDGLRLFRSLERWLHEQPAARGASAMIGRNA